MRQSAGDSSCIRTVTRPYSAVIYLLFTATIATGATTESPVGLVIAAGGSKLIRSDTQTPVEARAGDLLFPGDSIRTESARASFLHCPIKAVETLGPKGEIRVDVNEPKLKSGEITDKKPTASCFLPQVVRVATASQQHYGALITRDADQPHAAPTARSQFPPELVAELAPFERDAAANPHDAAAHVGMAAAFEKHKLPANALEQYSILRSLWPEAIWVKAKIFDLKQELAAKVQPETRPSGKTYALLIGVSKYKQPELSLQFAAKDATAFAELLRTPRGGGIAGENLLLLTDENATTAAVRNGFQDFLKRRAGKGDTVVLMIAGHGTTETPVTKGAYILTYDSDPQDLFSTALPMAELKALFEQQLARVGRVLLFVDVCKSGAIGSIRSTAINGDVEHLAAAEGDLFGFMASRPRELSLEGPQFGGGHGAFSHFVLKGLQGDADSNHDGVVDADELIKYVADQVPAATGNKQHPREFGAFDNSLKLAGARESAVPVALHWPVIWDSRHGEPLYFASAAGGQSLRSIGSAADTARQMEEFTAALKAGRILPDGPRNAFDVLQKLKPELSLDGYTQRVNELRVALEDRAQAIFLRYLEGDEAPQTEQDFRRGAEYMKAAQLLTPDSLYLEARRTFFEGRYLLFKRQFQESAKLLEDSIRIDPGGAYSFNALGIAYLEQGAYDKAIPAFQDANRRAPHWSYPLHNLALAYVERGDYDAAIASYRRATQVTPQFSYLPYNLGLLYQRIGLPRDAQAAYLQAMKLAPGSAEPYNAIGALYAAQGKRDKAEKFYREALSKNPASVVARQNLAILLAAKPDSYPAAIRLWRENLRESPDYVPSRISFAEALAHHGETQSAIEQYETVIAAKPDYVAARLALAQLLVQKGDNVRAIEQLREALKREPRRSQTYELIGDIERASGRTSEAQAAYEFASRYASDSAAKKSLRKKLKGFPVRPDSGRAAVNQTS